MTDTIRCVQWNVGGQDLADVEKHLTRQLANGVTAFTLQEVGDEHLVVLAAMGLEYHVTGWVATAWSSALISGPWLYVAGANGRLAAEPWTSGDGKRVLYADIDLAILCDNVGRSITLGSYKLPPNIQPKGGVARRIGLATEALVMLDYLAEDAQTAGFLAGADVNYDEDTGHQVDVLHDRLTNSQILRLHTSGKPTLGRREVDIFQTIRPRMGGRLRPVGDPWVAGKRGSGIHRLHGQEFVWA